MATYDLSLLGFDNHSTTMLNDMYQACTLAGAWNWIKTFDEESFMFSNHPMIKRISDCIEYQEHSGASFDWTMRHMESLAKEGIDNYARRFAKTPEACALFLLAKSK